MIRERYVVIPAIRNGKTPPYYDLSLIDIDRLIQQTPPYTHKALIEDVYCMTNLADRLTMLGYKIEIARDIWSMPNEIELTQQVGYLGEDSIEIIHQKADIAREQQKQLGNDQTHFEYWKHQYEVLHSDYCKRIEEITVLEKQRDDFKTCYEYSAHSYDNLVREHVKLKHALDEATKAPEVANKTQEDIIKGLSDQVTKWARKFDLRDAEWIDRMDKKNVEHHNDVMRLEKKRDEALKTNKTLQDLVAQTNQEMQEVEHAKHEALGLAEWWKTEYDQLQKGFQREYVDLEARYIKAIEVQPDPPIGSQYQHDCVHQEQCTVEPIMITMLNRTYPLGWRVNKDTQWYVGNALYEGDKQRIVKSTCFSKCVYDLIGLR